MNTLRLALGLLIGAGAGYAYYATIGCWSGKCLIGGDPYLSSAYFGGLGWLIAGGGRITAGWIRRLQKRTGAS